jgi:hypothetical protein
VFYDNQTKLTNNEKEINDWMLEAKKIERKIIKNTDFKTDIEADKEFERLQESISEFQLFWFACDL